MNTDSVFIAVSDLYYFFCTFFGSIFHMKLLISTALQIRYLLAVYICERNVASLYENADIPETKRVSERLMRFLFS